MTTELTSCPDANLEAECRAHLILAPVFHEGNREECSWSSGLGYDVLLDFQSSVSLCGDHCDSHRHTSTQSRHSGSSNSRRMAPVKAVQRMGTSKVGLSHSTGETRAPNAPDAHKSLWQGTFFRTRAGASYTCCFTVILTSVQKVSQVTQETKHFCHQKYFPMVTEALMCPKIFCTDL